VRDVAAARHWRRLHALGAFAIWFGAIGAGFDALENVCLLLTLGEAGAAFRRWRRSSPRASSSS
jgi:hypothetical protein